MWLIRVAGTCSVIAKSSRRLSDSNNLVSKCLSVSGVPRPARAARWYLYDGAWPILQTLFQTDLNCIYLGGSKNCNWSVNKNSRSWHITLLKLLCCQTMARICLNIQRHIQVKSSGTIWVSGLVFKSAYFSTPPSKVLTMTWWSLRYK